MLRITELRLPLEHAESALRAAVLARLGLADAELKQLTVFKRSHDARKKSAVVLTYTLDCEVADEAATLRRCAADRQVRPSPDTRYRCVAAPAAPSAAARALTHTPAGFGSSFRTSSSIEQHHRSRH